MTVSPEIAPDVRGRDEEEPMEPAEFQRAGAAIEAAVAETIVG